MAAPIPLRPDFEAPLLRKLALGSRDPDGKAPGALPAFSTTISAHDAFTSFARQYADNRLADAKPTRQDLDHDESRCFAALLASINGTTGSSGLALCLFGGDIRGGGMKPLMIVISFDVSEQIMPGSLPGWVASLVHEFGFDRAEAAFHRSQQFPFRLMDWIIPAALRTSRSIGVRVRPLPDALRRQSTKRSTAMRVRLLGSN